MFQDIVGERRIGALVGVRIRFARDLRPWISPFDWRCQMRHPFLLDQAIHHIDLLRAITGLDVAAVDARSFPSAGGPFQHDPTVSVLLELADGIVASYDGTWVGVGSETSWNGDWELIGRAGRATWSGGHADARRSTVMLERAGGQPARVDLPPIAAQEQRGVLAELRASLVDGRQPETSARDNLSSLAAVLAMARSCEERRPVPVREVLRTSRRMVRSSGGSVTVRRI